MILVRLYGIYGGLDLISKHSRALAAFMFTVMSVRVRENWKFPYQKGSICSQGYLLCV